MSTRTAVRQMVILQRDARGRSTRERAVLAEVARRVRSQVRRTRPRVVILAENRGRLLPAVQDGFTLDGSTADETEGTVTFPSGLARPMSKDCTARQGQAAELSAPTTPQPTIDRETATR